MGQRVTIKACCRANGLILIGTKNSQVVMLEEKKSSMTKIVVGHSEGQLSGVATHPLNPNLFVSVSEDSTLKAWDVTNINVRLL